MLLVLTVADDEIATLFFLLTVMDDEVATLFLLTVVADDEVATSLVLTMADDKAATLFLLTVVDDEGATLFLFIIADEVVIFLELLVHRVALTVVVVSEVDTLDTALPFALLLFVDEPRGTTEGMVLALMLLTIVLVDDGVLSDVPVAAVFILLLVTVVLPVSVLLVLADALVIPDDDTPDDKALDKTIAADITVLVLLLKALAPDDIDATVIAVLVVALLMVLTA